MRSVLAAQSVCLIYTHVMNKAAQRVRSPLDAMPANAVVTC
jgi:hypothetical protein